MRFTGGLFPDKCADSFDHIFFNLLCNLTPVPRPHYGVPVTASGAWRVLLNADETRFGGSGYEVPTLVDASDNGFGGNVAVMSLPPLSMLILRRDLG